MYLGQIIELSPADDLYDNPLHPYTISLLSAIPIPDPEVERKRDVDPAPGRPAEPREPAARMPLPHALPVRPADTMRARTSPSCAPLEGHLVKCHFAEEIKAGQITAEAARSRLRGRGDPEGRDEPPPV